MGSTVLLSTSACIGRGGGMRNLIRTRVVCVVQTAGEVPGENGRCQHQESVSLYSSTVVSLIATSPLTSRDNEPRWRSNQSCVLECFLSPRMSLPLGDL